MTKKKFYQLLNLVENPTIFTREYRALPWQSKTEFVVYLGCSLGTNKEAVARFLNVAYIPVSPITLAVTTTMRKDYNNYKTALEQKWRRWLGEYQERN